MHEVIRFLKSKGYVRDPFHMGDWNWLFVQENLRECLTRLDPELEPFLEDKLDIKEVYRSVISF